METDFDKLDGFDPLTLQRRNTFRKIIVNNNYTLFRRGIKLACVLRVCFVVPCAVAAWSTGHESSFLHTFLRVIIPILLSLFLFLISGRFTQIARYLTLCYIGLDGIVEVTALREDSFLLVGIMTYLTFMMIAGFWLFVDWKPACCFFASFYSIFFLFVTLHNPLTDHLPLTEKFVRFTPIWMVLITGFCCILQARHQERKLNLQRMVKIEAQVEEETDIFEGFPLGLMLVRDNRLLWWNKSAAEIFPSRLVPRMPLFEIFEDEDLIPWIEEVKYNEIKSSQEFMVTQQVSHAQTLELTATEITWHGKNATLLTLKDITKEREIEIFKTKWISTVSHEFKTPLNTILNLILHLKNHASDETTEEFLDMGHSATELLIAYVGDLLDYHQLQSQKFDVSYSSFNIREIISRCSKILQLRANDRNIELSVEFDKGLPDVISNDAKRLQQILINLVGNALKFSPAESEIRIIAKPHESRDVKFVRISVIDQGIGIRAENLSHLFQEFGRVHSTENSKMNPQGVGLGLWISNSLASRMGKRLQAFSRYGSGSTFMFDLLIDGSLLNDSEFVKIIDNCEPPEDPYERYLRYESIRLENSGSLEGLDQNSMTLDRTKSGFSTIDNSVVEDLTDVESPPTTSYKKGFHELEYLLPKITKMETIPESEYFATHLESDRLHDDVYDFMIVDDDYCNRYVLSILCKRAGMRVKLVPDGTTALNMYINSAHDKERKVIYRCIIMDHQMPEMNGPETVRKIREFERTNELPKTRILGHTAFSSKEEVREFYDSGIDGMVQKPITWDVFKDVVNDLPISPNSLK